MATARDSQPLCHPCSHPDLRPPGAPSPLAQPHSPQERLAPPCFIRGKTQPGGSRNSDCGLRIFIPRALSRPRGGFAADSRVRSGRAVLAVVSGSIAPHDEWTSPTPQAVEPTRPSASCPQHTQSQGTRKTDPPHHTAMDPSRKPVLPDDRRCPARHLCLSCYASHFFPQGAPRRRWRQRPIPPHHSIPTSHGSARPRRDALSDEVDLALCCKLADHATLSSGSMRHGSPARIARAPPNSQRHGSALPFIIRLPTPPRRSASSAWRRFAGWSRRGPPPAP